MWVCCWIGVEKHSVLTPPVPLSSWAEGCLPLAGWPWEHGSAWWDSCLTSHSLWVASLFTYGPLVLIRGQVVTVSSWDCVMLALIFPVLLLNPVKQLNKENCPVKPGLTWARWRRCPVQRGSGPGWLTTCWTSARLCGVDSGSVGGWSLRATNQYYEFPLPHSLIHYLKCS